MTPHDQSVHAEKPMLTALLNVLAPLLVTFGITDLALARQAAGDALARHGATNEAQWLAAAQIVGYGLAGLDMLRVSAAAPPDGMKAMRDTAARLAATALRASRVLDGHRHANGPAGADGETGADPDTGPPEEAVLAALRRASARVRAAQEAAGAKRAARPPQAAPTPAADSGAASCPAAAQAAKEPAGSAEVLAPSAAFRGPPAPGQPAGKGMTEPRSSGALPLEPDRSGADSVRRLAWAGAMTQVAEEFAATLPVLALPQRRLERLRIKALSSVAHCLTQGGLIQGEAVPAARPPSAAPPKPA